MLFGSAIWEAFIGISGRVGGGVVAEMGDSVYSRSNGLMPNLERKPSPLKGTKKWLLDLIKNYHKHLLLGMSKRGHPLV